MCGPFLWGFWWVFPLVGLVMCLGMMLMMSRHAGAGHGGMCMGGPRRTPSHEAGDTGQPNTAR